MNWGETVLKIDSSLTPTACDLINLIERYFRFGKHCRFHPFEAAALLGRTVGEIKSARDELLQRGYLWEINCGRDGKPRFMLHFGRMRSKDDEAA
jgi:hypothetical protein